MDVYEFEKSLLTRMQEISTVLGAREGVPIGASAVRTEWANYVEIAIEPTGWQALWRVPRVLCEDLAIPFPTVIMGTVEQVLFDELKATFMVEAVQDDEVHLPERQTVSLEELWPLKDQENDALNVDRTADCIDRLRFFYQHIWMPWDNDSDDDIDWAGKQLESRVKFYYDLKNKAMSKRLSSHVLALLAEANYIQKKRELLEMEIDEDEEDDDPEAADLTLNSKATEMMKLHLRLNAIRNEIDILENPAMREVYEKVRFPEDDTAFEVGGEVTAEAFVVTHVGTLDQQVQYLNEAKRYVDERTVVRICDSLQAALDRCKSSDELYLPPGKHMIKFLEYLNSAGSLRAISSINFVEACAREKLESLEDVPVVSSKDDDSILLTIDGDYCFENIMLDCANVRTGVLVKRGNVTFKNCCLVGDPKSTTKQGVVIFGNSTVRFENTVIRHFSTGVYSNQNCTIALANSTVQFCTNGLEVLRAGQIVFANAQINGCKSYGVVLDADDDGSREPRTTFADHTQIDRREFRFSGDCTFRGNGQANLVVFNGAEMDFNSSCFADQLAAAAASEDLPTNVSLYRSFEEPSAIVMDDEQDQDGDNNDDDDDDVDSGMDGRFFNDLDIKSVVSDSVEQGGSSSDADVSSELESEGDVFVIEVDDTVIEIDDSVAGHVGE
uniref:Uncharacterized protein n=1 Tax=Culex tarsalis TaxID=7177 RepID=A0A1Q3EXJ2_CULTA